MTRPALVQLPEFVRGVYRHSTTGGVYRLVDVVRLEQSCEPMALYRDHLGNTWVRPWKEFGEWVQVEPGKKNRRFVLLHEGEIT